MYAYIKSGSRQYRVQEGDILDVDLLELSGSVEFNEVVFFNDGTVTHVGAPFVKNCVVHAEVLGEVKGDKVINFKIKKRKRYRRTVGHRQQYSRVKITKIAAK
jgi:large subunit ribosomal protein L21